MGASGYRQAEFASIGGLDQDFVARLDASVSHRGAFHQHLTLFGRPDTVLLPDDEKTLVVVIVQRIEGQVAPDFAFSIERDSQSKRTASFRLVHAAHVADGGDKIIVE